MKKKAQIVMKDGRLVARVERSEACMKCRACDYGAKAEMLVKLPAGTWREGDEVEIELESGKLPRASLLAYGIPLAGLLIGLLSGCFLRESETRELWQAALGLAGTVAGFAVLKLHEPRFKAYRPGVAPCANEKGANENV